MIVLLNDKPLARGRAYGENPRRLKINGEQLVQEVRQLRSVNLKPVGRGNVRTEVSFEVERVHADAQAAMAFVFEQSSDTGERAGLVRFVPEGGDLPANFTLKDAILRTVNAGLQGKTSLHRYILLGAQIERELS